MRQLSRLAHVRSCRVDRPERTNVDRRPGLVLQWWAGDGIAVLVIGGPLLLWAQRRALVSSRWLELVLVVLFTAGLSVVAFRFGEPSSLLFLPTERPGSERPSW